MTNFSNMKGFTAINNFTAKKSIKFDTSAGTEVIIKNLVVIISTGARFSEDYTKRPTGGFFFFFHPYGIISVGEEYMLSKEELEYLIEKKLIELSF